MLAPISLSPAPHARVERPGGEADEVTEGLAGAVWSSYEAAVQKVSGTNGASLRRSAGWIVG